MPAHALRCFALCSVVASVVATSAVAAGTPDGGSAATPPASPKAQWRAFALEPGSEFQFEVSSPDGEGAKRKVGQFTVQLEGSGSNELAATWSVQMGKAPAKSLRTSELPQSLVERSRPKLIAWPEAAPFLATVLAQWWESYPGFEWRNGAHWPGGPRDVVPLMTDVVSTCESAGRKGFKGKLTSGKLVVGEVCVDPSLPLPLYAVTFDGQGRPRFEARLLSAKVPPVAAERRMRLTKLPFEEARKRVAFRVWSPKSLPKGVELVESRLIEHEGASYVVQQYQWTKEKRLFQIDQYDATGPEPVWPEADAEAVTVGGLPARLMKLGGGIHALRWTKGATRILVNGAVGREDILRVGESLAD